MTILLQPAISEQNLNCKMRISCIGTTIGIFVTDRYLEIVPKAFLMMLYWKDAVRFNGCFILTKAMMAIGTLQWTHNLFSPLHTATQAAIKD